MPVKCERMPGDNSPEPPDMSGKERYIMKEVNGENQYDEPICRNDDALAEMLAQDLVSQGRRSYLRVSTRDQAYRGGEAEGFLHSSPARGEQAEGSLARCHRGQEFVDRGASAENGQPAELQCIWTTWPTTSRLRHVHKIRPAGPKRADDVEISKALDQAGVRLVSTTESIDQTPFRHAAARHHVFHRRVLLAQPRNEVCQRHEPKGPKRRNRQPRAPRLP